jgi:serine phosphatase RsbU (regulator of sigma subunit)
MDEELKVARDIQMSMLPNKAPKIEGFAIAARYIPAREVGGDFYDFIEVPTNGTGERSGIIIGDVSGKAMSGALVMAASGVVEGMNDKGKLYGFERFMASIEAGRGLSGNTLLEKLMDDVACYVGDAEPHDDLTIVVVKVE